MATKKPKGPIKVTIDEQSACNLEAALRAGLTGAQAHILDDASKPVKKKRPKKPATIELDAPTVARFADHLRKTLTASSAHIGNGDVPDPDQGDTRKKKK
jgi:hypothetical protein